MSLSKYCLDTHPLVWYFKGEEKKLSSKSKKILIQMFSGMAECYIASILFLEAFHISLKDPGFVFPDFVNSLRLPNIILVPLDKTVLSACYKLPRNFDIHDRVIAATAKVNGCVLVTKDEVLRKSKAVKTLW